MSEEIQTQDDAIAAARARGYNDWKDVPANEADFDGFTSTAEYANYTLPYLEDLAEGVEDTKTQYLFDELVNFYWESANEAVEE